MKFVQIGSFGNFAIHHLRNLNIFQSRLSTTEQHELHNQKLATRLFLLLLTISFIVLLIYTSSSPINKTVTINAPTLQQYTELYTKYSVTLVCPCTQIAIDYDRFLTIRYKLHQVCSSDFVSPEWFKLFEYIRAFMTVSAADFRGVGHYAFHGLKSICNLVNETIRDSLMRFNTMAFVSADVLPSHSFQFQQSSIVNQFRSTTTKEFLSSLRIIRDVTQVNSILSFIQSNAQLFNQASSEIVYTIYKNYGQCLCSKRTSCSVSLSYYDGLTSTILYNVPGMYQGCYIFEALLQSDLRCFYNQTCLQKVLFYANVNITLNLTVMNQSANNRFLATTTIEEMLDELMVDDWQWSATYDRYFNECQPIFCSYTQIMRNDAIYIITATISLLGGLVTVLRLLVPRFVQLIRRKRVERSFYGTYGIMSVSRIRQLWKARKQIYRINLFVSDPPTMSPDMLRHQLLSTHVFLALFISSLIVLLIYTSAVKMTKTIAVNSPAVSQYIQLYERYGQKLTCACSHIAIDYGNFFDISYKFHAVCQSDFVTEKWINYMFEGWGDHFLNAFDFRITGISTFGAISSMCILVNDTITNNLGRFYTNQLVSTEALPMKLFQSQMSSQMEYFQSSTVKEFLSALQLIKETTYSNALYSSSQSNGQLFVIPSTDFIGISIKEYNNCSCAVSSKCLHFTKIANDEQTDLMFIVPGMYIGCYMIEALLQSNLICFYNQTCLNELMSHISRSSSTSVNITSMSPLANKRFSVNQTIGDILNELMVDEWQWSADYDKYFNSCQPLQCSYTEEKRNDAIYIITALIGLVGGLVKALRLLIPRVLLVLRKIIIQSPSREPFVDRLTLNNLHRQIQCLRHLNLFRSISAPTSQRDMHIQILSTRLFLFSFISSVVVLVIYTATIPVMKTSTIKLPTLKTYLELNMDHGTTLFCPCNSVSVKHDTFLVVNYTYHPICQSDFIEDEWIKFIYQTWNKYPLQIFDIRWRGVFVFQALRSFCQLIDQTIAIGLTRFYADRYISMSVSPLVVFQSQMNALVNQFQASTIREFIASLELVREYTNTNNLYSVLRSNGYLYRRHDSPLIDSSFLVYNGSCICGTGAKCFSPAAVYNGLGSEILYYVPGFYIGCTIIEALLQSNLHCLYSSTCVERLAYYIDSSINVNVTSITASSLSRFLPTHSVEEILNELMVDEWQWSADYEKYYNACQPIQCSYTESRRNNLIYIVTTFIGLVGGLVTALKLTVPRLVFLFYHVFKPNRAIVPRIFTVTGHVEDIS